MGFQISPLINFSKGIFIANESNVCCVAFKLIEVSFPFKIN